MAYDFFSLNKGQEDGSPVNVVTGTIDLAASIAQSTTAAANLATLQTLVASGTVFNSGATNITTTFNTDLTAIVAEVGSVVTALGTLSADMIYLYNAGMSSPPNLFQSTLAMKVIWQYMQSGANVYDRSIDTSL